MKESIGKEILSCENWAFL